MTVNAHGTATDSLGVAVSDDAAIPHGTDDGLRVVRRSLLQNRVLWGSVATQADGPDFTDDPAGSVNVGLPFWVIWPCRMVGCRIYKAPNLAGDVPITLYDPAGDAVATKTVSWGVDEGGWREILFDTPVDLEVSPDVTLAVGGPPEADLNKYTISYYSPNSWYAYSPYVWQYFNWSEPPIRVESFHITGGAKVGGASFDLGSPARRPTQATDFNYYVDPIVEWDDAMPGYEGGTDYFDQWVNGPDDSRFPFGVFFADPPFLEDYASVGVNLLMAGDSDAEYTEAVKAADMWHLPFVIDDGSGVQRAMASDAAYAALVKGYYLIDEPDQYWPYTPPGEMLTWLQDSKKLDSSRPMFVGMGRVVGINNTHYHQPQGASLDYANQLWRGWAAFADVLSGDFYTLADDQGRGYGWGPWTNAHWVRRLKSLNDGKTPIWLITETTSSTPGQPIPREVHSAIWSGLIEGAKGVILFDHRFASGLVTNDFAASLHDPPMRAMLEELAPLLQTLKDALFAPEAGLLASVDTNTVLDADGAIGGYGVGAKVPMHCTTRVVGSTAYMFAMTIRPGSTEATFAVPTMGNQVVTVIGESRTVLAASGVLTDDFVEDYEVHLYSWPVIVPPDHVTRTWQTSYTVGAKRQTWQSFYKVKGHVTKTWQSRYVVTVAAPAFPADTTLIDDFNRGDNHAIWEDPPYDTVWTAGVPLAPSTSAVWALFGNRAVPFSNGAQALSLVEFGPNLDLEIGDFQGAISSYFACYFCIQGENTSGWSAYWLIIDSSGSWLLRKRVGGVVSTVASGTHTIAAGDTIGIRRFGSAVEAYVKPSAGSWTLVASGSDGSISAGGPICFEASTGNVGPNSLNGGTL